MKVTILGGGNMGTAYAVSLTKNNFLAKDEIIIIEKNAERLAFLQAEGFTSARSEIDKSIGENDFLILAVKPQGFTDLAQEIGGLLKPGQIVISIMAGITIGVIQKNLSKIQHVVRAMPNTPCQLGMGITGYVVTKSITRDQLIVIDKILNSNGRTVFMKEEGLLDAVTAVSGSGPAYFYYFLKNMIEAGVSMGLEEKSAILLAKQTMFGSYHLLNQSGKSLDELINAVTSKGGTTEAALKTFESNDVGASIQKGLKAAEQRAKELAK
ncbi:MAG: pyrroline-5-carboxylate reductase [Cyclobacteriaceae bacterium]